MQDFRKLRVWHLSQRLADRIYELTLGFPDSQKKGLTDQLCRASDSVTSNIAEGCGRQTAEDKVWFYHVALGSINEVDNDLIRAKRIGLVKPEEFNPLNRDVIDVRKMLVSLIKVTGGS
jgi:four helix bundle protein